MLHSLYLNVSARFHEYLCAIDDNEVRNCKEQKKKSSKFKTISTNK